MVIMQLDWEDKTIDQVYVFKDVLTFEVVRGGWYKSDETKDI